MKKGFTLVELLFRKLSFPESRSDSRGISVMDRPRMLVHSGDDRFRKGFTLVELLKPQQYQLRCAIDFFFYNLKTIHRDINPPAGFHHHNPVF